VIEREDMDLQKNAYRLEINLDKAIYGAGDTVNGQIKLNFKEEFKGNKVNLIVRGREV
jgi:hypothetical protein